MSYCNRIPDCCARRTYTYFHFTNSIQIRFYALWPPNVPISLPSTELWAFRDSGTSNPVDLALFLNIRCLFPQIESSLRLLVDTGSCHYVPRQCDFVSFNTTA
jgi:hypothetical protein